MRLGTVRRNGATQAFRQDGSQTTFLPAKDIGDLLALPEWEKLAGESGQAPDPAELAPPVLRPGKFICAGLNYFTHAQEVGKEAPQYPTLFAKMSNTLLGARQDIRLPAPDQSTMIDWEAELGIVIGQTIRNGDHDEARASILGYTVLNDVSVRDWQKRTEEWFQGKNFDATTPMGPVITTSDEFDPDAGPLVECLVNGEIRQAGKTDDMIFSPADLVVYISRFMTLEPGDIIASGTPAGVGAASTPPVFLAHGDVLTTRIEGIGELRNCCMLPASEPPLHTRYFGDIPHGPH